LALVFIFTAPTIEIHMAPVHEEKEEHELILPHPGDLACSIQSLLALYPLPK